VRLHDHLSAALSQGNEEVGHRELGVGVEVDFRGEYVTVIAPFDGSPAARAGVKPGDQIVAIDGKPVRGERIDKLVALMRGPEGTKVKLTIIRGNAADPHEIELTRETPSAPDVTGRLAAPGVGYVRIAAIGPKTPDRVKKEVADLTKAGASSFVLDVRRTAGGPIEDGIAVARLFVSKGTLAMREVKGAERATISAAPGDGAVTQPAVVLIDTGTSGAAELFAAALSGNKRADLVGERTIGRAATQRLIKLPDGSGLWLSTARYLTPSGAPLHEKGLEPVVAVDEPDVEFGQPAPATDPTLDKAIAQLKKAA